MPPPPPPAGLASRFFSSAASLESRLRDPSPLLAHSLLLLLWLELVLDEADCRRRGWIHGKGDGRFRDKHYIA